MPNKQRWVIENAERRRAQQARWYRNNAERIAAANARRQSERVMANREYYKKHPEKMREKILKHEYGITLADYNVMLEQQNGECRICRTHHKECRGGVLHVDHCHSSERIRGLLCGNCNRMLGLAKDTPETLLAAARYLVETGGDNS